MGLKDLKLPVDDVEVPGGGSFTVKGLSFMDMRTLFTKYAAEVTSFFDLIANGGTAKAMDVENAAAVAAAFIRQAPALAAETIALAAGEPDAFGTVLTLPFPVQIEALKKIGKLTFGTDGSAKKFFLTVSELMNTRGEAANP